MSIRTILGSFLIAAVPGCFVATASAVTPVANQGALPPASQFLAEKPGFTSWRVLAQVELVKHIARWCPGLNQQ